MKYDDFNTLLVHSTGSRTRAIAPAIIPSAAFGYESPQEAEAIFSGELPHPLYARVGSPTVAQLENTVARIEGGVGAVATSSGMGALSMVLTAFLGAGDEVLCIGGFFGGTYTLVNETMRRFGIHSHFCALDDFSQVEKRLQGTVKMVLIESVGNPSLQLPDLPRIIQLCNQYNTLLLVDNTVTPLTTRPLEMGADIVVHSSTKAMSGHSAALGGIAVLRATKTENEKLRDPKYKDLHPLLKKMGEKSMIAICKKRALRDIGMSANAFAAFLTMLGLETLALRLERITQSVATVAQALHEQLPPDIQVLHPSLASHPDHQRYLSDYTEGCGSILTLECGSKERAFALLEHLELVIQTANIGDNRTLALHMASTIYREFDPDTRTFLGVTEGLVRVSVGLENPQAIIDDFVKAATLLA